MTRILIFSDTHRYIDGCIRAIDAIKKIDAVIHAGDHDSDAEDLASIYPDIPMYYVRGNCDFSSNPSELVTTIGGKRIFIAHGHTYGVKQEYSRIISAGSECGAELVVFGHTHNPVTLYERGMTVINPGSARYSRSYAVAEIENDKLSTAILDIPF